MQTSLNSKYYYMIIKINYLNALNDLYSFVFFI